MSIVYIAHDYDTPKTMTAQAVRPDWGPRLKQSRNIQRLNIPPLSVKRTLMTVVSTQRKK